MDALWYIELFGRLKLIHPDRTILKFKTQKTASLLAYLACHRGRPLVRDAVCDLFWPDAAPEDARNSFRVALNSLRRLLEPPDVVSYAVLIADRTTIYLNPDAFQTDVMQFEHVLKQEKVAGTEELRKRARQQAIALYKGAFLPDCEDEWAFLEQIRLGNAYEQVLRRLTEQWVHEHEYFQALETAMKLVAHAPVQEEYHQLVLRLYAKLGQFSIALQHYQEFERSLETQEGTKPGITLVRIAERLAQTEGRETWANEWNLDEQAAPQIVRTVSDAPSGTVTVLLLDQTATDTANPLPFDPTNLDTTLQAIWRAELRRFGGLEAQGAPRALLAVFAGAADALSCAVAIQNALHLQPPSGTGPVRRGRIVLNTGDIEPDETDYSGPLLDEAILLLAAGYGGQMLCTEATAKLVQNALERDISLHKIRAVPTTRQSGLHPHL